MKDPDYIKASRALVYDLVFTGPASLKDSIRYMETAGGLTLRHSPKRDGRAWQPRAHPVKPDST